MNTNKILIGTVVGGIAFFFMGWIVYGILLKDFMANNYNACMMKSEMDYVWWALIVSNFVWALIYAIILDWSNMRSMMGGLKTGALFGFLITLGFDLSFYSMSSMFTGGLGTVVIDVIVGVIYSAIGGALIGWVMGRGATEATA